MTDDEMNCFRADATDLLLKKLRAVNGVVIRPYIGVLVLRGMNLQKIEIEDAELLENQDNLHQFLDRKVEDAADTLFISRTKT